VERLTTIKLRVGLLRRHLQAGTLSARELDEHLAAIEQEIDRATAPGSGAGDGSRDS
jgi:hypothetical protein